MKGKLDGLEDTLLGLWNVVVDAGDIASTTLLTAYLVDAIYEGVTGEERPSLLERNDLARGVVDGATNAVNYVGDTFTGKKSGDEILSDIGKLGEGLYNEYLDPFAKDAQYKQDNLFNGGLWTRSEDESYAKGQNEFKKDMVVAEVAVTVLSAGTGTTVMRTAKMADKLDGPNGKKKSGDHEGNGVLLPNSSIDDAMSAMLKDGKLKTHGKSFAESMIELQEKVDKFLKQMTGVFNGRIVVLRDAVTGQPMVYWMRNDDLPGGNRRRINEDDEGPDNSAKIPRTGPEWDEYFRSRYGDDNVDWKTSSEYKLYGPYHIPYTPKIRPNAIITNPSLAKGGKPEGEYAETKGRDSRGLERQNEAADVLAEQGYRTIMLDEYPDGNGYGIDPDKSPDFIIERQVFDCYAPGIDTKPENVLRTLREKTTKQAKRIVLNLNDYPIEKRAELIEFLKSQTHKDLKHLNELLIIEDRQVTRAYWRFE
ncbi:hypothetical protein [Brevibacillus porteri]|uniref:CdiA C-terminal domain-containing protein n=1 Tax=Brevibacillus porteri TaxID=2126350 RepID=UPI003625A34C